MVLAMALKAQEEGLALPAAIASITPCTDLSVAGDTHGTLEGLDPVLSTKMTSYTTTAYVGHADPQNPLISPYYAEYSKAFPPTIIQTGTRDLLLSDCVRLHQKMKAAGVDVELSVREGMWHGYHLLPNSDFPEAKAGFQELEDFFRRRLEL